MIRDLDETDPEEVPEYDLCIVGSGPAGMTLANELVASGMTICVLESGLMSPTAHGDRLKRVKSEGIHIKAYSRERVFGGASTTWAGLSSPFDAVDFAERPYLVHSGWPLSREELFEDYAAAAERYRFPPLEFFGQAGFGALRAKGDLEPEWRVLDEKVFLAAADPQEFGGEYEHVFEREGIDLWLDATLLRLEVEARAVTHGVVRTRGGRELNFRADRFVLAAGGIENARLLLVSKIGNEHDQVGRCLMNHPKNYTGRIVLTEPVEEAPYFFGCLYKGFAGYAGLRIPEAQQLERELLNTYVRFEPIFPWSDNEGVESLVTLVKRTKFLLMPLKRRSRAEIVYLRDYSETGDDSDLQNQSKGTWGWLGLIKNVLFHLPSVMSYAYYRLTKAKPRIHTIRIRNFMEMEPHPENRVTLGQEADPYGQPTAFVTHAPTELDKRSLLVIHEALKQELEAAGWGRLETDLAEADPWPITQDASHHMGTTRMGHDPKSSVVDANCRVHALENLYVAGASVLPTSGCANPTFTLVALAIRLARHMEREPAA